MSYQCMVPGCPGMHESKWQVCAALDAGRVNAPLGTTSKPVATEPQGSAGESPASIPFTSNDRIQALRTRFNNPEKQWSRAHTESLFNEIERLTRESEAWDKASLVAIIAERDRLREALQTSLRCLQAALGPGFKVEPLPQDSPSETSGAPVTATQLLEAVAGAVLLIRADICDCERDGEETHRHLCRKFGSPLKANDPPSTNEAK